MLNTSKSDNRQHIQNECLVPHITQTTEAVYTDNRLASTSGTVMLSETYPYQGDKGGTFNRHAVNYSLAVKLPSFPNVEFTPLESDYDLTFKVGKCDISKSYKLFADKLLREKSIGVNNCKVFILYENTHSPLRNIVQIKKQYRSKYRLAS